MLDSYLLLFYVTSSAFETDLYEGPLIKLALFACIFDILQESLQIWSVWSLGLVFGFVCQETASTSLLLAAIFLSQVVQGHWQG